jgi:hypothetical protein
MEPPVEPDYLGKGAEKERLAAALAEARNAYDVASEQVKALEAAWEERYPDDPPR